jgi:hypothetical protein
MSTTPTITDNCVRRTRGRCLVYWRDGPDELWQGGHAPVKLARIRAALQSNQARGSWKHGEYRLEPVELSEQEKERLAALRRG